MTIKELTNENRALRERIDALNELLGKAHDQQLLAMLKEVKLKVEIKRLENLLNPKPEGKK